MIEATGNCSPALCERDTALALAFPLSFPALPPAMVSAARALGPAEPPPPLAQHRPPLPPQPREPGQSDSLIIPFISESYIAKNPKLSLQYNFTV